MQRESYKECELGAWIVPHLIEDLCIKRDLAQKVLEAKDLYRSVRVTYIPSGWDMPFLEREYLELDTSSGTTLRWLAMNVQKFVLSDASHVVVLEHPCAEVNDQWVRTVRREVVSYKENVLLDIYDADARDIGKVEQRIRSAEGPSYMFGVMSSLPKCYLPLARSVDEDTVDLLANQCESAIFAAFDGTGYVICRFVE